MCSVGLVGCLLSLYPLAFARSADRRWRALHRDWLSLPAFLRALPCASPEIPLRPSLSLLALAVRCRGTLLAMLPSPHLTHKHNICRLGYIVRCESDSLGEESSTTRIAHAGDILVTASKFEYNLVRVRFKDIHLIGVSSEVRKL